MLSVFYGLAGAFAGTAIYGVAMLFPSASFTWEGMAAVIVSSVGLGILKGES
ncbi:MAG: hypothetical protein SPI25_07700 [Dialister sp.]|nr:hypothetical protein [Dialister sp.]